MYQKPTEPKSIGGVLDDVFGLFRESFVHCLPMAAAVSVAVMIPSLALNSMVTTLDDGVPMAQFGAGYLGWVFVTYLIIAVGYSALIHHMDSFANNRNDTLLQSLSVGASKSAWVFIAMMIYFVLMGLGMALLLIPGIIVAVSLSFFIFAIVLNHKNGFTSLSYSHSMVWGQWWRVATLLGVASIASMVVYALFLSLIALFGVFDIQNFIEFSGSVAGTIIGSVVGLPIMIFMVATGLSIYYDLELVKQGSDLQSRMVEM